MKSVIVTLIALLCPVVLIGCGTGEVKPPTFSVSGKVTYKNQPVADATVVLTAQTPGGQGAVGNTDSEGNYEVGTFGKSDGAVAGKYLVKVFKYEMTAEPPSDGDVMSREEEEEAYSGVDEVEESGNLLPKKYENASTSGFSVEVIDSPVVLNLDLD